MGVLIEGAVLYRKCFREAFSSSSGPPPILSLNYPSPNSNLQSFTHFLQASSMTPFIPFIIFISAVFSQKIRKFSFFHIILNLLFLHIVYYSFVVSAAGMQLYMKILRFTFEQNRLLGSRSFLPHMQIYFVSFYQCKLAKVAYKHYHGNG